MKGTIKASSDISRVFESGMRKSRQDVTVIALRKNEQHGQSGRAAFIAGKKFGNAIWRNKAKRRLREGFKASGYSLEGYDVLFIARKNINEITFDSLVSQIKECLNKLIK